MSRALIAALFLGLLVCVVGAAAETPEVTELLKAATSGDEAARLRD